MSEGEEPESDALARLFASTSHIDEAGFTARVMARLPPRRVAFSRRASVILGSTFAGCGLAALIVGRDWTESLVIALRLNPLGSPWVAAWMVVMLAGGGTAALARVT